MDLGESASFQNILDEILIKPHVWDIGKWKIPWHRYNEATRAEQRAENRGRASK